MEVASAPQARVLSVLPLPAWTGHTWQVEQKQSCCCWSCSQALEISALCAPLCIPCSHEPPNSCSYSCLFQLWLPVTSSEVPAVKNWSFQQNVEIGLK